MNRNIIALCFLLMLSHEAWMTAEALRLGFDLPGGTRVTYRDGLLRIKPPAAPKTTPAAPGSSGSGTTLLDPEPLAVPWEKSVEKDGGDGDNALLLLSIEHRETESKGYGVFYAGTEPLAGGTFLGCYEGRLLGSRDDLDGLHAEREADLLAGGAEDDAGKVRDYVLSLDGGAHFLDGFDLRYTGGERPFTPAHLNHADKTDPGCNVVRKLAYLPDDFDFAAPPAGRGVPSWLRLGDYPKDLPRVAFFAGREIFPGEELAFDYGTNFWNTKTNE